MLALFAQLAVWMTPYFPMDRLRSEFRERELFFDKISAMIRKTHGTILSEDMGLLIANGREIFYEPFPMGQMSYSGLWDENLIIRELDRQTFPLAILYCYAPALRRNRTFNEGFFEMFNRRYKFIGAMELPRPAHQPLQALYFYAPRSAETTDSK